MTVIESPCSARLGWIELWWSIRGTDGTGRRMSSITWHTEKTGNFIFSFIISRSCRGLQLSAASLGLIPQTEVLLCSYLVRWTGIGQAQTPWGPIGGPVGVINPSRSAHFWQIRPSSFVCGPKNVHFGKTQFNDIRSYAFIFRMITKK